MGFIGLYRATYDYVPQADNEIAIQEGDVLCVIQKGDDDWWKAKKKAQSDTDDEPEGLIPGNYVEEAKPIGKATAQYEYTRQTDEELSFESGALLDVYDTSDEDWTLAGLKGEYGFVPAIYIELEETPPPMPSRPRPAADSTASADSAPRAMRPSSPDSSDQSPAAALAGIIQSRSNAAKAGSSGRPIPATPAVALPPRKQVQFTPEESEEEAPAPKLPRRPTNEQPAPSRARHVSIREPEPEEEPVGVVQSPPHNRVVSAVYDEDKAHVSPGGFHLYNIFEMIEVMGKNRKTPVTLGINIAKGVISISSENSREAKEWTADKLTHYSLEGKHVFVELVRPSKSIDFHAGAKDTAQEIVSALSELSGVAMVEGLHGFFAAGAGTQKTGKILYDFEAGGDDEVSVSVGDEVAILDDTKNDDWWLVQRADNGKKGVVPSSYVKPVTGTRKDAAGGDSFVERNRREEERLARQSSRATTSDVGPGLTLPERGSSLTQDGTARRSSQKGKRDGGSKKSMPDSSRVRTWTDRSGTFKVEAEFIGLREGKIHLHKVNGVKIAVPVTKMSQRDLEYVEKATGKSLDDDKSLADLKRSRSAKDSTGASIQKKPDYDWFDFFLQCGVNPQICERYAMAFRRDEMGEENMQDVTPELLRNLGIKEGDILRIMKFLDAKFARTRDASAPGGLFSGPGGALRDNTTKKTRPTPANPAKDAVDEKAFEAKSGASPTAVAATNGRLKGKKLVDGFDDDAWEPRESKTATPAPVTTAPSPPPAAVPAPVAATPVAKSTIAELSGLSLSTPALLPSKTAEPAAAEPPAAVAQPSKPQGATPSLFDQLAQSAVNQHQNPARQRPQPPVQTAQNAMIAPPPGRAASAPQNFNHPGGFNPPAPLQPQYTMHTQVAPPGQSMNELNQRFQAGNMMPQNNFNYPQQAGPGFNQFAQGMQPGYQPSIQQQFINGQQVGSPFADPMVQSYPNMMQPQHTMQPLQPQHTTINAMLPPALMPQPTGPAANQPFPPAYNSYAMPPVPPMPPMPADLPAPRPLVPQKTGPPPPVRFGVKPGEARRQVPMPTGRKANLSQATPDNPFGF